MNIRNVGVQQSEDKTNLNYSADLSTSSSSDLSTKSSGEWQMAVGLYRNVVVKNRYQSLFPQQLITVIVNTLVEIYQEDKNAFVNLVTSPAVNGERLFFARFQLHKEELARDDKKQFKNVTIRNNQIVASLFAKQNTLAAHKENPAAAEQAFVEFLTEQKLQELLKDEKVTALLNDKTVTELLADLLNTVYRDFAALDTKKVTLNNTLEVKRMVAELFAPIEASDDWKKFWSMQDADVDSAKLKLDIKRFIANGVAFCFLSNLAGRDAVLTRQQQKLSLIVNSRKDAEEAFLDQKQKILDSLSGQFTSATENLVKYVITGNTEQGLNLLTTWEKDLNQFFLRDPNLQFTAAVDALGAQGYTEFNKKLTQSLALVMAHPENKTKNIMIVRYSCIILDLIAKYYNVPGFIQLFTSEATLHKTVLDLLKKAFECLELADPLLAKERKKNFLLMQDAFSTYIKVAVSLQKEREKKAKKASEKNPSTQDPTQEVKVTRLFGLFTVIDAKSVASAKGNPHPAGKR